MTQALDQEMANAIRMLAVDAVQQANSGHPGMPMGMADIAVALWKYHYRHNPANPYWFNRDRFILSNGHGSMLHYALLHLSGYDLPIDELKNFRQLHSKTPGHPEVGITPGIETTTGPLGQGLANAVGMALAERLLAQEFNEKNFSIVDHHTYVFAGDGCLMEGISHEVCSLAGTLKLNKLIVFYDDNGISIDGKVEHWFSDNTPLRFEAYGWHVIRNVDGHNLDAINRAIEEAKQSDKPVLIACKTIIGKGSPNLQGSDQIHGAPLGAKEIAQTRQMLNWTAEPFVIEERIYQYANALTSGSQTEGTWNELFAQYQQQYPQKASEFLRRVTGQLPSEFGEQIEKYLAECVAKAETIATRKASLNAISAYAEVLPELLGGSADLTGSNLTQWKNATPLRSNQFGNHINYGVREFGMSAIMNGIALYGGYIPFGATFLTFSDYSRNAIRMAALMRIRSIFVFTHDSIGLGEDGPTHQSIEHVSSLRLIPHLNVWRPADTVETAVAWAGAITAQKNPSALIFSRQNLPFIKRTSEQIANIARGGYILQENPNPDLILLATGSEISLALQAYTELSEAGVAVRVVSMPSTTIFDQQSEAYRKQVLPDSVPTIAIEAGSTAYWYKYVGKQGAVIGIDCFGESAPAAALFEHFGFTVAHIVDTAEKILRSRSR